MRGVSMKQYDIPSLISHLIGGIAPIADSAYDKKVLDNLKEYTDVTEIMLFNVMKICECRDSLYGSEAEVGKYAYKRLLNLRQMIDEYIRL